MDTGLNPQQIASYFSVKSYFLAIWDQISHFTRQGFAFLGISTIDESIMVDITTRRRDNLHGDKNIALFELFEIQKAILAAKRVSAVTGIARNDSKVMLMESPEELVKKNLVQVDSTTVPLMPNEFVQEATHYDIQWRLSEIFFTIFTFGLYYFFVARFRHGLRSALVITNFRLLEISKYKPNQCCMPGENFTYAIRSWFLNGIDAGIVCREPTRVWGAVQLRYGCLYIQVIRTYSIITFTYY